MAIVHRDRPIISRMTIEAKLSESVSIVSDGGSFLVTVRNSIAGVFDSAANAISYADGVNFSLTTGVDKL